MSFSFIMLLVMQKKIREKMWIGNLKRGKPVPNELPTETNGRDPWDSSGTQFTILVKLNLFLLIFNIPLVLFYVEKQAIELNLVPIWVSFMYELSQFKALNWQMWLLKTRNWKSHRGCLVSIFGNCFLLLKNQKIGKHEPNNCTKTIIARISGLVE